MSNPFQRSRSAHALRLPLLAAAAAAVLLLGGCGPVTETISESTPGAFNHYVIYPISMFIAWLAGLMHDNYGLAIIAITILIRLALFPLMLRQTRSQRSMRLKMDALKPELKRLEDKYNYRKDEESVRQKQQEMLALYQKHNVNPLAIGCLPMLLQLPILTGLYYAIRMTPSLAAHSFLWFKLGEPDMLLPVAAALVYFIQFKVSQRFNASNANAGESMARTLSMLGYVSPIMMGLFALTAPAAISLYWVTSGAFLIAQTWLLSRMYGAPGGAGVPAETPSAGAR